MIASKVAAYAGNFVVAMSVFPYIVSVHDALNKASSGMITT
jgi:predicted transcriptional regulator